MLADQMIDRLEYLHQKLGVVHRDLKPDNFLIGTGLRANTIYMIDFGLANSYMLGTVNKVHKPERSGLGLVGSARYCSLNVHYGRDISRRDDMESLGYIFVYFLRGITGFERKKLTRLLYFAANFPKSFVTSLSMPKCWFHEEPHYQVCKRMFRMLFKKMGYTSDRQFDWTSLLNKKRSPATGKEPDSVEGSPTLKEKPTSKL